MRRILIYMVLLSFLFGCSTYQLKLKDDPCNDKYLLQLEKKSNLTPEEMLAYAQLKQLCQDSKFQTKQLTELEDIATATMFNSYFVLLVFTAGLAVALFK